MPGISAQEITRRGRLGDTGQRTCYARGDDGAVQAGLDDAYYVLTTGQYALTTPIEVAHLALPTISFAAPNQINDAGAGLVTILTGDSIVVKGSALNDGIYTVAGGGVAAGFTTVEAIVNEAAGPYITLYKRALHSNNCVFDRRTGLYWSRYTSNGEKVGDASNGPLVWYDVALNCLLHNAANTVQIVAGDILRIVGGAAELTRYHEGDLLMPVGFANADNNLPFLYVVSATVNGPDLDILTDPGDPPLIVEGAVGDQLWLNCRSIFNYAAGANRIGLAGYTDWRNPDDLELLNLRDMEAPTAAPNAATFPGWPTAAWTATTRPDTILTALYASLSTGQLIQIVKTSANALYCALVRGGA